MELRARVQLSLVPPMAVKKAYFIGICGAGMSATAKLLLDFGWQVSGSDDNFYPPVSTYLDEHHIPVVKGYNEQNILADVGLIVIGKNARLTPEKNAEVKKAFESNVPIKSFPEVLGELSHGHENIVIAGSYGKSTCTALIAWALECAGKNPSYFIGAIPKTPSESSKKGSGKIFVLEGDEYPTSNWDTKSKFLYYHPSHLLLTSLTHDHLDIYKTPEDYRAPFKKLIALTPPHGIIVACGDGEGLREELNGDSRVVWYSIKENADWTIKNLALEEKTSFSITHKGRAIASIRTSLLGMHNIENILGAGALLLSLDLVTPKQFEKAMETFKALDRRLDKKSEATSVPAYEGFGSSYTKARSAIEAIRLHFPNRLLTVIFEPYTFSWQNRDVIHWYDTVFKDCNNVLIYKPPGENRTESWQLKLIDILDRVQKTGLTVGGFETPEDGLTILKKYVKNNSVILILSSGGFGGFIDMAVNWTEKEFLPILSPTQSEPQNRGSSIFQPRQGGGKIGTKS